MPETEQLTTRQREITRRLLEQGFLSTSSLATSFGVSDMTIRRDARQLEKAGAALIVHGGLTLPPGGRHTEGFVQRARVDARAKARVARACARLVGPQDRVLIDAGTTAYEVARVLASSFEGTLITHSAPVIQLALRMPRVTTIALGGELLLDSQAFIGDMTVSNIGVLRAETAFIGAAAVNDEGLFIERNLELRTKRTLMRSADRVVLAVTASKMSSSELVHLCDFEPIHLLVTDAPPPEPIRRSLAASGTDLLVATD
ncbi:DeoR/GlpR family DNA-binding transcription regulator [Ruania albidiflava]|uniref:DeoR/GlpR family DNA-binding transcription regulator n=1 Tax=Ruania albidiflava TaxID=366586 RepID=UPI0003B71311|nr:DeoR/GlpR family DNA-binding transcription regulator [Ruania albidiflava]